MNIIEKYLSLRPSLIVDGALGTELSRRGHDLNDSIWSAKFLSENPDAIRDVQKDYLSAGADIIISATYQATYEGFKSLGLTEEKASGLMVSATQIAKTTRDQFWEKKKKTSKEGLKPLVAASIGPYGAFLADGSEYTGNYDIGFEGLKSFHRKRLDTIIRSGPDVLAFETIPCLEEAMAMVSLLENFPDMTAWVCFSARDGKHINNGESIRECAEWLEDKSQVVATGVNCTGPEFVSSLIREIKAVSTKPVIVYPNKGGAYDALTKTWEPDPFQPSFDQMAEEWFKAGARLIGGCCQTTPKDIEAVAKRLNTLDVSGSNPEACGK